MGYCVQADVEASAGGLAHLVEVTDVNNSGGVDAGKLAAAIVRASTWIDGFLRKRFATPLASPFPDQIIQLCADETVYQLKQRRRATVQSDVDAHDEREKLLMQISTGEYTLGIEPNPPKSSAVTAKAFDLGEDDDSDPRNPDAWRGFW